MLPWSFDFIEHCDMLSLIIWSKIALWLKLVWIWKRSNDLGFYVISSLLIDISNFCMCQNQSNVNSRRWKKERKKKHVAMNFYVETIFIFFSSPLTIQARIYLDAFFEFSILINTDEQNELNMSTYRSFFWHKVFKLIKALKTDLFSFRRFYTELFFCFIILHFIPTASKYSTHIHGGTVSKDKLCNWMNCWKEEKKNEQEVFGQIKTIQFVRTASPVQSSSILIRH